MPEAHAGGIRAVATNCLRFGRPAHSLDPSERLASLSLLAPDTTPKTPKSSMSRLADELLALSKSREVTESTEVNRTIARRFGLISIIGDAVIVISALVFAFCLKFHVNLFGAGATSSGALLRWHLPYIAIGGAALLSLLAHYGMYHPAQLLRYRQVSFLIIKGCSLWFVGTLFVTSIVKVPLFFPALYLTFAAACTLVALLAWRGLLHRISTSEAFSRHLRERILFVGWNESSERLTKYVTSDPSHAYTVVGCVPPVSGNYEKTPPAEIPHIAAFRDIINMLRAKCIDIVMLADRTASMTEIDDLATICEKEMVQLKVIPSYFQILVSGLSLQTISGIPILGISQLPLDRPANQLIKRISDIVGSIVGLILSAPIVILFGAWVYIESPGPIFYRQRRAGKGGARFDIIKIRSMKLNAEAGGKPGWTVKDDPRRLKIGAFMRKWNIDELPQFWNVLKGEMSLVGPRPERPELIETFKEEIAHYNARHGTKPGVTGWAAINGLRGDTDLSERIRCDLYYLENWSLWLDIQIMFLTFFRRKNAG